MRSAYHNLQQAKESYYRQCRMADFWIDLKKAPVEEVHRLTRIVGVSEVRDRLQFKVVVDLEGVVEPISAMVLSLPDDKQDGPFEISHRHRLAHGQPLHLVELNVQSCRNLLVSIAHPRQNHSDWLGSSFSHHVDLPRRGVCAQHDSILFGIERVP